MSHVKEWEAVIGLEIHTQLSTQSKIFSGASTRFGAEPNTQACAIDLGMPGVLPVVNAEVYKKAVAFGLGIGAHINKRSVFDRKNYFYPDLPKGYQITQLAEPIVLGGQVEISLSDGQTKIINVTRAHLEEDAGKSLHESFHNQTGIDLNRAGIPLLEIVSEPELRSAKEAVAYARYIHQLVTYLGVSDGNMSEGSLRCDANVSVREKGETKLGTRTETKNVNSFRFLEAAINFEIDRQINTLEAGGRIIQETRLYDAVKNETRPMRSKETATDYRYFPEPDLLPIIIDEAYIESVRAGMPELPVQKMTRYVEQFQLSEIDAALLSSNLDLANYFEEVAKICGDAIPASNWIRVELMGRLNKDDIEIADSPVKAAQLGKTNDVDLFIEAEGLTQVSDSDELETVVDGVIANNPGQVEQYRAGKTKLMGFFVGQVMKETQGKANPKQVNELVSNKLKG